MFILLLPLSLGILSLPANCQKSDSTLITFQVQDSITKGGIELCSIKFLPATDNIRATVGGISNQRGHFSIKVKNQIFEKGVKIEFTAIGYAKKDFFLTPPFNEIIYIFLSSANEQLENVTVQTRSNPVSRDIDKLTFKIQPSNYAKNAVLADIINNVPSLSLDQDGNVNIKSNIPADIYIDGKLVSKEVLKALPLEMIEKVEVIDVPSVSALNTNGIVNIVTKRTPVVVTQGRTTMRTGILRKFIGPYVNLLSKGNKFFINTTLNVQNRVQDRQVDLFRSTSSSPIFHLSQNQDIRDKSNIFYVNTDLFYDIDTLTRLSGSVYFNKIDIDTRIHSQNRFLSNDILSQHFITYRERNFFSDIEFRHKLSQNSTLVWANRYSISKNPIGVNNSIDNKFQNPTQTKFISSRRGHSFVSQIQIITKTKKELELDLGLNYSILKNITPFEALFLDTLIKQFIVNAANSDESYLTKTIITPFASTRFKWIGLGFRLGIRGEYSDLNFAYRNANTQVPQIKTFNLLPNVLIRRTLKNNLNLSLQYRQVIKRPDMFMLNQFTVSELLGIQSTGNSFLIPESNHQFTFSVDHYKSTKKILYYNSYSTYLYHVNNPFFEVLFVPNDSLLLKRFANLRSQTKNGLSVSSFLQFIGKGSINLTLFVENTILPKASTPQLNLKGNYFIVGGDISADYQMKKFGSFNLNLTYRNLEYDIQYRLRRFPNLIFSYTKQFLKNSNLSVILSYLNVFNRGSDRYGTYSNNTITLRNNTHVSNNNLMLTLNYSFGKRFRTQYSKTSVQPEDIKEQKKLLD